MPHGTAYGFDIQVYNKITHYKMRKTLFVLTLVSVLLTG